MAFLGGIFGTNHTEGRDTAKQQIGLLNQGTGYANQELWNGEGAALGQFNKNYYDPYTQTGDQANAMYANALGLNGAGGNQTATGAFQAGPGYQFAMDQGVQALDRSAAGSGMFGSGNAAMALNKYGQGMANQEYGNWLSRLGGLGAQGLVAAGGQTGRQGNLAGINMWGAGARGKNYFDNGVNASNAYGQGANSDTSANAQGGSNILSTLLGGLSLAGKFF